MNKIAVVVVLAVLSGCSSPPSHPDFSSAMPYTVISTTNISLHNPSYTRYRVDIYSAATFGSMKQRAQTVMKAAYEYQNKTGADYVLVYLNVSPNPLLDNKGYYIASADYSPDGGGVGGPPTNNSHWNVSAAKHQLKRLQIRCDTIWEKNKARFSDDSGTVNDQKMDALISKDLHLTNNQVIMCMASPFYDMKSYLTN